MSTPMPSVSRMTTSRVRERTLSPPALREGRATSRISAPRNNAPAMMRPPHRTSRKAMTRTPTAARPATRYHQPRTTKPLPRHCIGAAQAPDATEDSAASTMLVSSSARVIGPTPPGLGLTHPATSATSRATSPAILPSTRLTPTSRTAAPGLTMSLVTMPGTPAAAMTMSAWRTSAARSLVPVWHSVTVAFSLLRVRMSPSGRPTVRPRPMTTTLAPAICTSWRRSSSMHPIGVHGRGAGLPSASQPRFIGCRPSTSLLGSTRESSAISSRPVGCWTRKPVHVGSALSSSMTASTSAWLAVAGRSRRRLVMPISAQSLCLALTYQWLPGSSPTSTVPRPGTTPCSRRRATRWVSSTLIALRVALPSRICAVTVDILPPRPARRARGSVGQQAHQLGDVALPRHGLGPCAQGLAAADPLGPARDERVERVGEVHGVTRVDVDAVGAEVLRYAAAAGRDHRQPRGHRLGDHLTGRLLPLDGHREDVGRIVDGGQRAPVDERGEPHEFAERCGSAPQLELVGGEAVGRTEPGGADDVDPEVAGAPGQHLRCGDEVVDPLVRHDVADGQDRHGPTGDAWDGPEGLGVDAVAQDVQVLGSVADPVDDGRDEMVADGHGDVGACDGPSDLRGAPRAEDVVAEVEHHLAAEPADEPVGHGAGVVVDDESLRVGGDGVERLPVEPRDERPPPDGDTAYGIDASLEVGEPLAPGRARRRVAHERAVVVVVPATVADDDVGAATEGLVGARLRVDLRRHGVARRRRVLREDVGELGHRADERHRRGGRVLVLPRGVHRPHSCFARAPRTRGTAPRSERTRRTSRT